MTSQISGSCCDSDSKPHQYKSLESVWLLLHKFWSHFEVFGVNYHNEKKPFLARGPAMYTLSWGIHEVAVAVHWPGKLKSMMAVIE